MMMPVGDGEDDGVINDADISAPQETFLAIFGVNILDNMDNF